MVAASVCGLGMGWLMYVRASGIYFLAAALGGAATVMLTHPLAIYLQWLYVFSMPNGSSEMPAWMNAVTAIAVSLYTALYTIGATWWTVPAAALLSGALSLAFNRVRVHA
jgi:hypothetical protein